MKKIILSLATALMCGSALMAQTTYEAANLLGNDLNGTARFVGMGGAMSALGADISTMGTNPAGIGLYRRCDMMMTFSGNGTNTDTQFGSVSNSALRHYGSFDNVGMVFSNKHSNEGILRFINFGYNYHRSKNFSQNLYMEGPLNGLSQTGQMAAQVYDNVDNIGDAFFDYSNEAHCFASNNYYGNASFGWLSLMGSDARLVDANVFEQGFYYPSDYATFSSKQGGSINQHDFNLSFNFIDQVYFGATFSYIDAGYQLYSIYTEEFNNPDYCPGNYVFENWYKTRAYGYNGSFGAIIRPFAESSFRIGVAATTNTLYNVSDYNSAIIQSTLFDSAVDENGNTCDAIYTMDTQSEDAFGADCKTNYTAVTPGKVNVSLGYTLPMGLALGAEWESCNFSRTRLLDNEGRANMTMNEHTLGSLTTQNTLRLGVEKAFDSKFYARLGYNHTAGGYKKDAWKMIPINSVQTNTDYSNILSNNVATAGIGYHGELFYVDAAFVYGIQKSDFYPFDNTELRATSVSRRNIRGLCTLGMKF